MKTWETWLSHISTIVVTVSGLAYLSMKYLMETDDPFAVVNHPWQSAMLSLHVLAAPVLVFVIGLIANSHIQKKLRSGVPTNRLTGISSMISLPLMIVSGYALQVVTATLLMQVMLGLHLVSSSVFAVTYVIHQIVTWRSSARKPVEVSQAEALAGRQTA
jgi:uncharacterized membrane protein YidH (DUF202 family)